MKLIQIRLGKPELVKKYKATLEKATKLNKAVKIGKEVMPAGTIITIPTLFEDEVGLKSILTGFDADEITFGNYEFTQPISEEIDEPIYKYLVSKIPDTNPLKSALLTNSPKKYTIYPPMLLINNHNTFDSPKWKSYLETINSNQFYEELLKTCFSSSKLTHIALNKPIIEQDILRRPFNIIPLYGDFGPEPNDQIYDSPTQKDFDEAFWCGVTQNGIKQVWAPRYTMFSRGNIKEKARILNTFRNIKDKCVVDMYAGIGYFTLSYLKLDAKCLFCFELNPWSIRGLMSGCEANKIKYKMFKRGEKAILEDDIRCYIFQESNENIKDRLEELKAQGQPMDISHFNLGLLPSSKQSWRNTVEAFSEFSTERTCDVHVHENVGIVDLPEFMRIKAADLEGLGKDEVSVQELHLEKIKTFAPDVWHICADFRLMKKV